MIDSCKSYGFEQQIPAFRDKNPAQSQDVPAVPGLYRTLNGTNGTETKNRGTVLSRPLPIPDFENK